MPLSTAPTADPESPDGSVSSSPPTTHNIPSGLGIGRVVKSGEAVYNIFIEPQFTILHKGPVNLSFNCSPA